MIIDSFTMNFDKPVTGQLAVEASYKMGDKIFKIKLVSTFESKVGSGEIKKTLDLVGDAQTGLIENLGEDVAAMNWDEIQRHLAAFGDEKTCQLQKDGFAAFSAGDVSIPKVIHLQFQEERGDLHFKGAHRHGSDIYVFKIATGFPNNTERGLSVTNGLMIAFSALTGQALVVLKDEGNLTDLRTAIAGRIAAEELMPADELKAIGVLGTGVQARLQSQQLGSLYPNCRQLVVWGRNNANARLYAEEMGNNSWQVTVVDSPGEVAEKANLIVTTTAAENALLGADAKYLPHTVIIAIGADMPGKIELSAELLRKADTVLIDSIAQGKDHGNASEALKSAVIQEEDLQEFGDYIAHGYKNSKTDRRLEIFLSSGIGVQDLQIVAAVIAGSLGDSLGDTDKLAN